MNTFYQFLYKWTVHSDPYEVDFAAMARAVPVKRILFVIVAAFVVAYLGDFVAIELSAAKFETVTVSQFYATALKGDRVDYQAAGSANVTCVNSLFPHFGDTPCWYLNRHKDVRVDM